MLPTTVFRGGRPLHRMAKITTSITPTMFTIAATSLRFIPATPRACPSPAFLSALQRVCNRVIRRTAATAHAGWLADFASAQTGFLVQLQSYALSGGPDGVADLAPVQRCLHRFPSHQTIVALKLHKDFARLILGIIRRGDIRDLGPNRALWLRLATGQCHRGSHDQESRLHYAKV